MKNDTVGAWIEIPFEVTEAGRYSMSLFQHLREDNGIWKVYIDGKDIHEAGESQIAGGYRVSLVNQLPPEQINKTLDFYNVYRKNEHEDYIYGQRRERKIGLFQFEPGEHTLRLVCVGSNPASVHPETGKPALQPVGRCAVVAQAAVRQLDEWIEEAVETGAGKP